MYFPTNVWVGSSMQTIIIIHLSVDIEVVCVVHSIVHIYTFLDLPDWMTCVCMRVQLCIQAFHVEIVQPVWFAELIFQLWFEVCSSVAHTHTYIAPSLSLSLSLCLLILSIVPANFLSGCVYVFVRLLFGLFEHY